MTICSACGSNLDPGGSFYKRCGAPVVTAPGLPPVLPGQAQPQIVPPPQSMAPMAQGAAYAGGYRQMTPFQFRGAGLGFLWLVIWTSVVTALTLGLFFPWAFAFQQRWIASNTFIGGRQLAFTGSGLSFLGTWLLIVVLTLITLGVYTPWGYCRFKRWEVEHTVFAEELEPQA